MDKNFYEILEVDKKASPEIIKKAYNTLAKKYHPDLQSGERKVEYGEKLKLINEAYETLSDAGKRKEYDETLASESATLQEKIDELSIENAFLKNELKQARDTFQNNYRNDNYFTSQNLSKNIDYYNAPDSSKKSTSYNNNNFYKKDDDEYSYLTYTFSSIKSFLKKIIAFIIATAVFFLLIRLLLITPFFNFIH